MSRHLDATRASQPPSPTLADDPHLADWAPCRPSDPGLFHKTSLCRFFSAGGCHHGRACRFAHGAEELRQRPCLAKTRLCVEFLRWRSCPAGATCRFAHDRTELRRTEMTPSLEDVERVLHDSTGLRREFGSLVHWECPAETQPGDMGRPQGRPTARFEDDARRGAAQQESNVAYEHSHEIVDIPMPAFVERGKACGDAAAPTSPAHRAL